MFVGINIDLFQETFGINTGVQIYAAGISNHLNLPHTKRMLWKWDIISKLVVVL